MTPARGAFGHPLWQAPCVGGPRVCPFPHSGKLIEIQPRAFAKRHGVQCLGAPRNHKTCISRPSSLERGRARMKGSNLFDRRRPPLQSKHEHARRSPQNNRDDDVDEQGYDDSEARGEEVAQGKRRWMGAEMVGEPWGMRRKPRDQTWHV